MIYKAVRSFIVPPDGIIYTNEITEDDVGNSAASIREAPGTYQEMIVKRFELRVTIVGQQIFAARINSQQADVTRIDRRRSQLEDMYESIELDSQLTSKLLEFHTRAGLIYGAYDLIIDQDGLPIFLECNPGGQWLWLEIKLGLPISQALARLLAGA